jgi:pyrroloquinoline quinone biosynthesis protein D
MTGTAAFRPDDVVELNPMFLYRWEEAQQAHVLLYPEGLVKLNETAGTILGLVIEGRAVSSLVSELESRYETQGLEPDVLEFLAVAADKGWVRRKG